MDTYLFSITFLIISSHQCVVSSLNTIAMLISVFDLWILIDKCHLCVPTVHCGGTSRYNMCKNHSNTRSSCAITLKIKPTTMSWSRCCFKKKSRKLCITNKYKIHNKIYPIQHSARSEKRCIEETNRDEYKNITTRNVFGFFLQSIMDIADTTNQLPWSDFCVYRDFPRITIGVRNKIR